MTHRPTRRSASCAIVLLTLCAGTPLAPPAAAQDPARSAAEREAPEDTLGWSGNADFGLTVTRGNSETTNLSLGARVARRFPAHRLGFSTSFLQATEEGEQIASRGEAKLEYDYFPGPRNFLYARTTASFNEEAGLDLRVGPGLGSGYTLVDSEKVTLSARGGASWIREEFADGTSTGAAYFAASQSLELTLSETSTVSQEVRYNPRAEDLSDYLLHAEASLTTMISGSIGLRVSAVEQFDSTPFENPDGEDAEKHDLTLITGVTYSF